MKALKNKYFPALIIAFLLYSGSFAQINRVPGYGNKWTRGIFDSVLAIPNGLGGLRIVNGHTTNNTQLRYNVADSSVYAYTGTQWLKIGGGTFGSCPDCYNSARAINDTTLTLYRVNGDSTQILFTIVPPDLTNYIQQGDTYLDPLWGKIDSLHIYTGGGFDSIFQFRNGDSSLRGLIYKPDGLIDGGIVTWSGTGLIFDVSAAVYQINNVIYTSPATTVTLAASDPTNDRYDVIVVDITGVADKVTGTAAVNPGIPQIDDSSQFELATYFISAGATTPTGVSEVVIYNENIGAPEWTGAAANVTTNFGGTSNVFTGTKTTDAGSWTNGAGRTITYTKTSGTVTATDYSTLKLWVRLKANFNSATNISVAFLNGTTVVSNTIQLTTAGLVKNVTGTYQNISIPFNRFTFTSAAFNKIRFTLSGANASGFYLDYFVLQTGNTQITGTNQNITVTATGDATGTSTSSPTAPVLPLTLATVNSNVGSFTNANITVNAKGLVTAASNGSAGSGNTNSNIGSGYRLAVPGTNNVKTLFAGTNVTIDSTSNTNGLTINSSGSGGNDSAYVNISTPPADTSLIFTRDNNSPDTVQYVVRNNNQLNNISYTGGNQVRIFDGAAIFTRSQRQSLFAPSNQSLMIDTSGRGIAFSAWVKLYQNDSSQAIASKDDDLTLAGTEYLLCYYPAPYNRFLFQIETNTTTRVITSSIGLPAINTWYYVEGRYDQTNTKIYIRVNNTLDSLDFAETTFHNTNTPFALGSDANFYSATTNSWLNGELKNVRAFKRPLTTSESDIFYNSGTPLPYTSIPNSLLSDPLFISSWDFTDRYNIGADSR